MAYIVSSAFLSAAFLYGIEVAFSAFTQTFKYKCTGGNKK